MFEIIGIILTSFFMNGCDAVRKVKIEEVSLTSSNQDFSNVAEPENTITLRFRTIDDYINYTPTVTFYSRGVIIDKSRVIATYTNTFAGKKTKAYYVVNQNDTAGDVTFTISAKDTDKDSVDLSNDAQVQALQNTIKVSL